MTVWDDLVGQEKVSAQLDAAARDADAQVTAVVDHTPVAEASKMTHAWLFTGPPGSGRSTAARAFAAALQCVSPDRALGGSPGCGFCDGCHTSLIGTHADVQIIRTDLLSIGVKETRDLVRRAQMSPAGRRWQVIIVEDADRLTEGAGNVLLKAIEEPAPARSGSCAHPPSRTCCPPSAPAAVTSRSGRLPWTRSPMSSYAVTASSRTWRLPWPAPPRATSGAPAVSPRTSAPASGAPPSSNCPSVSTTWAPASRRPRS